MGGGVERRSGEEEWGGVGRRSGEEEWGGGVGGGVGGGNGHGFPCYSTFFFPGILQELSKLHKIRQHPHAYCGRVSENGIQQPLPSQAPV